MTFDKQAIHFSIAAFQGKTITPLVNIHIAETTVFLDQMNQLIA
jgi:hypothetical protein